MVTMRRWLFPLVLLVFIGVMIWTIHLAGQVSVVVESDRVRIGPTEWVPRCGSLPQVLIVPAGSNWVLPNNATFDCIEIESGASLAMPVTRLDVTTVLNHGTFDVACGAEVVWRDVPIDTSRDPFQWGNGLLNFGARRAVCPVKTPFVEASEDIPAGATSLTLASAPVGWVAGNELLLPDMRQIGSVYKGPPPSREAPAFIASISGTSLTLSKPLDFAHPSVRDPDGGLVLRPRVANLSRGTVIRSENPNGTRGHIVDLGADASWDWQGVEHRDLGRTRNAPRDSTSADLSHIGTNQIGKYGCLHAHQAGSSLFVRRFVNNVCTSVPGFSWAIAVHGTNDTLIQDNISVGYDGGSFVTEDGPETGNVFTGNVGAYSVGNGQNALVNAQQGCPGCEGAAFWLKGLANVIERNEAWNSSIGMTLFSRLTPPANDNDVPLSFRANVTIANDITGLEFWGTEPFPAEDHVSAHNRNRQVWAAQLGGTQVHLVNPMLIDSAGRSHCVEASAAYVQALEIDGGQARGCLQGIGMAGDSLIVRDVLMQNVTNLHFTSLDKPRTASLEYIDHRPLRSNPLRYVVYGDGAAWQPGQSVGKFSYLDWYQHRGARHQIIDWQGTGQDYVLMTAQQKRSAPAYDTTTPGALTNKFFLPESGLTMGQAWDKYGMSFAGDAVNDPEFLLIPGIINGGVRAGLGRALGVPRAVLTLPNMLAPAIVETISGQPGIQMFFMQAGMPSGDVRFTIDGGPAQTATQGAGGDLLRFVSRVVSDGTHTVVAWRELNGQIVATSELSFGYFVGTAAPPPPPPPPPDTEICGDGIDNDGDGEIDEGFTPPAVSVSLLDPSIPTAVALDANGCPKVLK
jgi:hypothetical protein